ncbi:hypothetical protein QBC33DRAFT_537170 [Phialemonium atrogriseum]|uniref:Uncharacterized protein n=1 Tax=Phialemonium atrogriseum TaxID=1093897 RepID=A0AAJ0C4W3_9PEZI|nr:uncharacterized protein QBC33DRAFT_537170 [Phialemonium atrogriseum]KAK1767736.1 hypothetical protein QBC33DRAFT_537170 [Phialemonium atrogriseum]
MCLPAPLNGIWPRPSFLLLGSCSSGVLGVVDPPKNICLRMSYQFSTASLVVPTIFSSGVSRQTTSRSECAVGFIGKADEHMDNPGGALCKGSNSDLGMELVCHVPVSKDKTPILLIRIIVPGLFRHSAFRSQISRHAKAKA